MTNVCVDFKYNDGGRKEAGYKGTTGDCFCRAVSIVTGLDYQTIYDMINKYAKSERITKLKKSKSSARTGVYVPTAKKIMTELGYKWVATMQIGSGCTVHLRADELPEGKVLARLSKHYTTMINGIVQDTYDPSREGTRCVYGYWIK